MTNFSDAMIDLQTTFRHTIEPELLEEIQSKSKTVRLAAGETILEIGQTVRTMPIIIEGSVKVSRMDEDGRELLLYYINPNESCAMTFTCCLQQYPIEIRAVAEDDVTMLTIPV